MSIPFMFSLCGSRAFGHVHHSIQKRDDERLRPRVDRIAELQKFGPVREFEGPTLPCGTGDAFNFVLSSRRLMARGSGRIDASQEITQLFIREQHINEPNQQKRCPRQS